MRSFAPILVLALAGCTEAADKYPSLLPRAAENQSLIEPIRPALVAAPDAALDAKIAEAVKTLDATSATFNTAAQTAEAKIAVARGLPVGSEGWLDAQASLGDLTALRGPILSMVVELEDMAIARGVAGDVPYPALDAAVKRADALAKAQQERINALEGAIVTP